MYGKTEMKIKCVQQDKGNLLLNIYFQNDKCCVKRDLLGRTPEQTAEGKRKEEDKS